MSWYLTRDKITQCVYVLHVCAHERERVYTLTPECIFNQLADLVWHKGGLYILVLNIVSEKYDFKYCTFMTFMGVIFPSTLCVACS